ncbi:conjugal transfer protein TraG, partial [Novosphingobium sp. NRRL B-2648]
AMMRNDLTAAQIQVGAMEGRREHDGARVTQTERANVSTEQGHRTGSNEGQRNAAAMLGLSVDETSRSIGFINALSGEARSSAISQLSRATGRNEAQVTGAIERYNAAVSLGTADGAGAEAAREGTSVYGRTRETAGYDFAERAGKLDAQREVGHEGTRSAARFGEQRRQSDNTGFAQGAAAAGASVREAARLDSFIQTLSKTAGNQVDIGEGGAAGIADRARNQRMTRIVDAERLTRAQGLLEKAGIHLSKREIAMDQNGDFAFNLTPRTAAQMWKGGLINESQLGAIANGGHARLSFAHNDLLVSSTAGFQQSARNDTSTRFEAGKQAGPDTIEHFMGGGQEGQAAMANWLRGGFEMDRKGNWRLKPQVADTLQRDVQAIMVQTGWSRSLRRSAEESNSMGTDISGSIAADVGQRGPSSKTRGSRSTSGSVAGSLTFRSSDRGGTTETAAASIDIINYDVRSAIAKAELGAAKSRNPADAFARHLSDQVLGRDGLRNRYLDDADNGRATFDVTGPLSSLEQNSVLRTGRFSNDIDGSPADGNSHRSGK